MDSMNESVEYINGYADVEIKVVLQLGYEMSYNDDKSLYSTYTNEVTEIIKQRLNPTTYQGTLENVKHLGTSGYNFVGKPDSETFSVVELIFGVTYRVSII
jgi:hypothetical protein